MYSPDEFQPTNPILRRKNPLLAKVEKPKDRTYEWSTLRKLSLYGKLSLAGLYKASDEERGNESDDKVPF